MGIFFSQVFTGSCLSLSLSPPLKRSYNWYGFFKKEQKGPMCAQGRVPQQPEPVRSLVGYTQHLRDKSGAGNSLLWGRLWFLKYSLLLCSFSGSLPDKKFDVDKRAMNLGDFNDIMRKDRSGFRPPNSKDMGTTDSGPYFEKVSQNLGFTQQFMWTTWVPICSFDNQFQEEA